MATRTMQALFVCLILFICTLYVLRPMENLDPITGELPSGGFHWTYLGYVSIVGVIAYFLFYNKQDDVPEKEKVDGIMRCYYDVANSQDPVEGITAAKMGLPPSDEIDFSKMRISEYNQYYCLRIPQPSGVESSLILDGGTNWKSRRMSRIIHWVPRSISDQEFRRLCPSKRVNWNSVFGQLENAGVSRADIAGLMRKKKEEAGKTV